MSILVVKEAKQNSVPELYLSTLPLEALKVTIAPSLEQGISRMLMVRCLRNTFLFACNTTSLCEH